MPRKININKVRYAKTLLETNLSIRQIQKELRRIFGSGMSPNQLIELKNKVENKVENYYENVTSKDTIFPIKSANFDPSHHVGTEYPDLRYFADIFNQSMNQFTEQLKTQQILLEELSNRLPPKTIISGNLENNKNGIDNTDQNIQDLESEAFETEKILEIPSSRLIFFLEQQQERLISFLSEKHAYFRQICDFLELSDELVEIIIDYLMYKGIVYSFIEDNIEKYGLITENDENDEEVFFYSTFLINVIFSRLVNETDVEGRQKKIPPSRIKAIKLALLQVMKKLDKELQEKWDEMTN